MKIESIAAQSGMDNRDIYEYGWGLKGQRIYGQDLAKGERE
jgi:hypothetical protein